MIDRHRGNPYLTGLRFTRPLKLLAVSGIGDGTWATRVGGNHALDSATHGRTQHWARTIDRAHDDLDGIVYRGRFAGSVCIAISERATDAFPSATGVVAAAVASRVVRTDRQRGLPARLHHHLTL